MLEMPILETARLLIRPFVKEDLPDAHRLFDIELYDADLRTDKMETLMGVMRKLGMWIEKNPRPEPPWLQVVGVLENNKSGIGELKGVKQ